MAVVRRYCLFACRGPF